MRSPPRKDKIYYRIGEVSEITGVKPYVIRYWEKVFEIRPERGEGLQRRYRWEDIERINTIKVLLDQEGLTIAGAKRGLQGGRKGVSGRLEEILRELKEELRGIKDILSP